MRFTAVLLAGGKSVRMGRDKAGTTIEGVPLWQRQCATLRAVKPHALWIAGPLGGPYAGAGVEIVPDDAPGLGPLGGVVTALRRMQSEWLLVLAIDLPAMTSEFLLDLLSACEQGRGIVPAIDGWFEALAAVYPRACLPVGEECLRGQDRSMQRFVREAIDADLLTAHEVPPALRALFRNINSPADLA